MWKRCVLMLLGVGCGGSNGEINLVLENKTASAIMIQESNVCGAGHIQILDDGGRALAWTCGQGTRELSSADAIAEPVQCVNRVRTIGSAQSLVVRWDGFYLEGNDCGGSGESFRARFCFGTRSTSRMTPSGQLEQLIDDVRCETIPFELGIDAEARYVVE